MPWGPICLVIAAFAISGYLFYRRIREGLQSMERNYRGE